MTDSGKGIEEFSPEQQDVVYELKVISTLVKDINESLQHLVVFTAPDGPLEKRLSSAVKSLESWNRLFSSVGAAEQDLEHENDDEEDVLVS